MIKKSLYFNTITFYSFYKNCIVKTEAVISNKKNYFYIKVFNKIIISLILY